MKTSISPTPTRWLNASLFFLLQILIVLPVAAQPSGGPYGPVPQNYALPEVNGKIIFVAPDGVASNSGEKLAEPTSLEQAIKQASTGDAIILRGGTYRTGNHTFNQGITLQPYADELPVLKGTYVASDWTNLGNGLWTTHWDHLFPMKPQGWWGRARSGKSTPLHRFNNDMVFIDGQFLQSAAYEGEVDANTFYIDYESGTVYIGQDPKDHLVEITAFDIALLRTIGEVHGKKSDKKGPVIKGITFTQYAYRAIEFEGKNPEGISAETEHGKDIVGTLIEHCSITNCSRVAAYLRGDSLTLRNCKVSNTSTEGIYILSSSDVLLERNIFEKNNIERIDGYFPSAVKIFNQCYRVTCNDNLVRDLPWSNGIWYDVGNIDGVFTNNWLEDVGYNNFTINRESLWPCQNAFFFEISKKVIVAGNVFVNCDHGIMVLNASDAKIWNNTFVNTMVTIGRDNRSAVGDHFGWHPATGPDVDERIGHVIQNNLITADEEFNRPMLFIWQASSVCDKLHDPQLSSMDHNVYVRNANALDEDLLLWGPADADVNCTKAYNNLDDFKSEHKSFSKKSKTFIYQKTAIYKGAQLNNFHLVPDGPISKEGSEVPEEIRKLLPMYNGKPYVGAYPPQ